MRRPRGKAEAAPGHHHQRVSAVHHEHQSLHDTHGTTKKKVKAMGPALVKRKS